MQCKKDISVTEICEKAGVSRNAYYRNFNSTDDIVIYCLVLKWAQYCEENRVPSEHTDETTKHLVKFFYIEREFIRAVRQHGRLYLVEELFRKVIIPVNISGAARYWAYALAYTVYSFIRAMIDNDFAETPEQIEAMVAAHRIEKTD